MCLLVSASGTSVPDTHAARGNTDHTTTVITMAVVLGKAVQTQTVATAVAANLDGSGVRTVTTTDLTNNGVGMLVSASGTNVSDTHDAYGNTVQTITVLTIAVVLGKA